MDEQKFFGSLLLTLVRDAYGKLADQVELHVAEDPSLAMEGYMAFAKLLDEMRAEVMMRPEVTLQQLMYENVEFTYLRPLFVILQ